MPGRKIRLTSGSSLIIIGTSLVNPASKTIKGNERSGKKNNQLKIILQIFLLAFHHFINEI
jgi:hypothetical protein